MLLYGETPVNGIVYDSRKAVPDCAFVCLVGTNSDGHSYAHDVYDKGCRCVVCQRRLELPEDCVQYVVEDTRKALAELSAQFYGYPAKKLKIIGVTGTKGKTSVATFLTNALNFDGHRAGYIGTTGIDFCGRHRATLNSTPESHELHKTFAEMLECGVEYVVMEVSSQAYKLERVWGIHFDVGVFTNLFPDHISASEHPDFEDYRSCKAKLFENSSLAVVNADDPNTAFMLRGASEFMTYSVESDSNFRGVNIKPWRREGMLGISYECETGGESFGVSVRTPGFFSVYNTLAVLTVCSALEVSRQSALKAFSETSVKGRFEIVSALPYATFILDYAHNELSLRSALETLKIYHPARLICMFGSIGGRASLRRIGLGHAAAETSDLCIITSDNPDNENPLDIMKDIERGIIESGKNTPYVMIADREQAVDYAVREAREGDIVLFAGKGHEDYQIIRGEHVHFSEAECIKKSVGALLSLSKN